MRLIDADAIIEVMKKCAENPENEQALLCYRYTQRILEEAPTVEDASPWHRVEDGYYAVKDGVAYKLEVHAPVGKTIHFKKWKMFVGDPIQEIAGPITEEDAQ